MNWLRLYNAIMRYYPGETLASIPKMTVWQFIGCCHNMQWFEEQARDAQRRAVNKDGIMGGKPGYVPKIKDIRAMAKDINRNLIIPEE